MIRLVFATNNRNKVFEIQHIIRDGFLIQNLADIGCTEEIEETEDTIEGNALLKARYVHRKYGVNVFADDSGLEVEALDNRPGVYSARYAGIGCTYADNVAKLLLEMKDISNRRARFKTVIALIIDNKEFLFEGVISGIITNEVRGTNGFGYDPLFLPDGYNNTFAEMTAELKNNISHRSLAVRKMIEFLQKKYSPQPNA